MSGWTKEQEEAILARKSNLLVAAAAGSGKTAVLVERIIQLLIKDRIDIDRLLIVTFTQAAASEMRERISNALLSELDQGNELEDHLRRQVFLLNRASISTLHAFCTEILRKNFHLVGIDPSFRIGDSTETELMKLEVLEELFESEYEKSSELFLALVEMFAGSKDDTALQELIRRCYEFIQSNPYPDKWLQEAIENFALHEDDFEKNLWIERLKKDLKIKIEAAADLLINARQITEKPDGPLGYQQAIADDLDIIEQLRQSINKGLSGLYYSLRELKFSKLGRVSRDLDEKLKNEAKALRDDSKKIIIGIRKLLAREPKEYQQDLNELYPYMKYLGELVTAFSQLYMEKKMEKGILDFNDLEHLSLLVLSNENVAEEYRRRYLYIFVDEYQDSNLVQETILSYIKQNDNLFLVGDVKQSIYRFRLADPSLFMAKQTSFSQAKGSVNLRIDLNKNFRSRPEILNAVNFIFKHLMCREIGEIDYDEHSYLYPGLEISRENRAIEEAGELQQQEGMNHRLEADVELHIIENKRESTSRDTSGETDPEADEDEGDAEELEEMEDIELEASFTAQRIKELTSMQLFDIKNAQWRPVEYRDIVILMRATRNSAGVFLEILSSQGIPVYADVSTGYFDTLEVEIFMNLLRLVDNKRQDLPLLSVMRSPIGNFDIDDFIKIRTSLVSDQVEQDMSFFDAIEKYIVNNTDDLQERLNRFMDHLNEWQLEAQIMRIDNFIWKLLMDTGYYYYLGAMPGGEQRQANLRILYDRAREFQKTSYKGLFNFIRFVDKLKSSNSDMGTASIIGESDNVVRIMSVHKSKGLEFPVVILAGIGRRFNIRDSSAGVLFHKDLGIGPRYVNPNLRIYNDTIARIAIRNQIRMENLAEEMRILYVACTRPKEKLIMIGSIKNLEKSLQKWSKTINCHTQSRAQNFLDWIAPLIIRHPHGQKLREWCSITWEDEEFLSDDSRWLVCIQNQVQMGNQQSNTEKTAQDFLEFLNNPNKIVSSSEYNEVHQRLNWTYPFKLSETIPSKLSVTQLSKIKNSNLEKIQTELPYLKNDPDFMSQAHCEQEQVISGQEKGSIVHFVMQHLDLAQVNTIEEIREQLMEMVDRELLRQADTAAVDIHKLWRFFRSPLGQRVLSADRVYREMPFNLLVQANEFIDKLEDCQEKLLIQGVIDLYFYEDQEIVLLDFKTDLIRGRKLDIMAEPYRLQLEVYQKALERILGLKVKQSYLYFFDVDREFLLI